MIRVFTRFPGFFNDLYKVPPFGVPEKILQVAGKPELHAVLFMDIILEMFVEAPDTIVLHGCTRVLLIRAGDHLSSALCRVKIFFPVGYPAAVLLCG
jgi:hypothetical protein